MSSNNEDTSINNAGNNEDGETGSNGSDGSDGGSAARPNARVMFSIIRDYLNLAFTGLPAALVLAMTVRLFYTEILEETELENKELQVVFDFVSDCEALSRYLLGYARRIRAMHVSHNPERDPGEDGALIMAILFFYRRRGFEDGMPTNAVHIIHDFIMSEAERPAPEAIEIDSDSDSDGVNEDASSDEDSEEEEGGAAPDNVVSA